MKEIVTKLLDWILPERGVRKSLFDELRNEINRLTETLNKERERANRNEERLQKLEVRFAKESCLRFSCKHRLSIDELPAVELCHQRESCASTGSKNGTSLEV